MPATGLPAHTCAVSYRAVLSPLYLRKPPEHHTRFLFFSLFLTLESSFTVSRAVMLLFYSFPLLFFTPLGAPISSSPFGSLFVFTCSFHLPQMPTAYLIYKCSLALDFIILSLFLPFFLLSIVILTNMLRFPCFF